MRGLLTIALGTIIACALVLSSSASDSSSFTMPDEYYDMLDALPEGVHDALPGDLLSDNIEDVKKGTEEMSSPAYIFSKLLDLLTGHIGSLASLFVLLLSIVIMASLISGAKGTLSGGGHASAFSFLSGLVICICVFCACYGAFGSVLTYVSTLNSLMSAMLPLMSTLYLMGGNVGTAAVSNASMTIFLSVSENAIGKTVIPFSSVCIALSAASAIDGGINMRPIGNIIKRAYTTLISLISFFLSALLGVQSTLAARSDTLAMKGVRFFSSSLIPIVGGAVGEGIRTAAASITYIRSAVGTVALISLLLAFASVFIYLLLLRFVLNFTSGVAEMLGCAREGAVLSDVASVVGYVIAAISVCSLMFVFALTIFIKCASAA